MSEARGPMWRAWTAALLLLAVPFLGYFMIRSEAPAVKPEPVVRSPAPQPTARATTVTPVRPSVLGRVELLKAAREASGAYAAQLPAPSDNVALAGRRFVLRLPFGCAGPAQDAEELGPNGWHYDADTQTLRAQVTPEVWTESPWALAASGQAFEAAEGFWIARAWSPSDTCPARPAVASPDQAAPPQTLGVARFFEPGSSRAARRNGEAYRFSKKVAPEQAPGAQGLRLLIEGRLSVDPSRQPIGCWAASPELRPVCIFNARFDRVAITDASEKTVFSEWKD
jgi:hypothetical protein